MSSKADSEVTCVVGYFIVMVSTAINSDDPLETSAAVNGDVVVGMLAPKPKKQASRLFGGRASLGDPRGEKLHPPVKNVAPRVTPLRTVGRAASEQVKRELKIGTARGKAHGNKKEV